MNINQIFKPEPPATPPGSAMVVNYQTREVSATDWIHQLEAEVLARAGTVTKVDNAQQNALAYEAQASLARYIRAVQNTEEAIKKPLNLLRGQVLALSKTLQAKVEAEGVRIGTLVAEFQLAEKNRAAALRRLQDAEASALEQERDKKLSEAQSSAEQDAIRAEYHEQMEGKAESVPEPLKVKGQVISEDWDIVVTDIWLLARCKPSCVKIEPRNAEIKSLLNAGVKVEGVTATKKVKAGVRLGPEKPTISV